MVASFLIRPRADPLFSSKSVASFLKNLAGALAHAPKTRSDLRPIRCPFANDEI
jgi:hypothetical protein